METEELKTLLSDIYAEYLAVGCPCRFPRFRFLTSFDFTDYKIGPTACLESELLINIVRLGPDAVYATETEPSSDPESFWQHRCTRCGTVIEERYEEYSINMARSFLTFPAPQQPDLGAPSVLPMPVVNGIYGFNRREWSVLDAVFRRTDPEEFVAYMTAHAT